MISGGSCLLGSINLSEFVKEDKFDIENFIKAVEIGVNALDDVCDEGANLHPLKEQIDAVHDYHQVGLGLFGLADMLIKLKIKYGSKESLELCDDIGYHMAKTAIKTSAMIAKHKGAFPKCNIENIIDSSFFQKNSDEETVELVKKYGIRNSQILTIPPTGSTASLFGVSTGVEPIYANYYNRKTESLHGKDVYYKVYTPIAQKYLERNNTNILPDYFIESKDIKYKDRILMQSVWQKHIDAAISSTINLPKETSVDEVYDIYIEAWKNKLKGTTIYRSGCAREGILSTEDIVVENNSTQQYDYITPISRKQIGTTNGNTYCKKTACGTMYITMNRDENGNIVESFVNTSKGGICGANLGAINRMISVGLRSGVKVEEIADQLKGINCSACTRVNAKGEKLDGISCPDILGRTLLEFYNDNKSDILHPIKSPVNPLESPTKGASIKGDINSCPDCGEPLRYEGGCTNCISCGFSKCN